MTSKEFAELLGAFAGDGWISKGNSGLTLFISGNPKNEVEYYDRIKWLFNKAFAIEVKPRNFEYWRTFGILTCKKKAIERFIEAGMPIGKKSLTVEVPESIKADKSLSKAFIRGLFDTDGCISFQKSYNKNASKWQKQVRHKPTILFTTMSKSLIQSLLEMTADLGFAFRLGKPQLPKYSKTFAYRIRLEGKANVKKFFKTIKPKNPKHLAKFNAWLKQGFN